MQCICFAKRSHCLRLNPHLRLILSQRKLTISSAVEQEAADFLQKCNLPISNSPVAQLESHAKTISLNLSRLKRLELLLDERADKLKSASIESVINPFQNAELALIDQELGTRYTNLKEVLSQRYPFYYLLLWAKNMRRETIHSDEHIDMLQEKVRQGLSIDHWQRSEYLIMQSVIRIVHFTNGQRCKLMEELQLGGSPWVDESKAAGIPLNNIFSEDLRCTDTQPGLEVLLKEAESLCKLVWEQKYRPIDTRPGVLNGKDDGVWHLDEQARSLSLKSLAFPLAGILLYATATKGFTNYHSISMFLAVFSSSSIIGASYLAVKWGSVVSQALKQYKGSQAILIRNVESQHHRFLDEHLRRQCQDPILKKIKMLVNQREKKIHDNLKAINSILAKFKQQSQ